MRNQCLAALVLALGTTAALAQTVRGAVTSEGDRPVTGVVVILVDPAAKEVSRALTNDRGEYRLTAPRAGSYRLRTMRIGFQSVVTEYFLVGSSSDVTRPLSVSTVAFALDTVRAVGRNTCRVVAGDSTSVVAAIWDQVRSALIATQLTYATQTIYSTSLSYERTLDARSQRIGSQSLDVRGEFVRQPWRSLPADSLRRIGYVYTTPDSSRIYNAPDINVLLSDVFVEDHCFRIAEGSDNVRLGIEFSPTPARRSTPEIRGTLWLDRRTNELIEMEHRYINRIRQDEERLAGGEVGFTRMRNGMWAISRWSIRMPMLVLAPVYSPTYTVLRHEIRLDSLKVTGGELLMATTTGARRDTIWMRPALSLRGTVLDSLSGTPIRHAIVGLQGTIQVDTTDAAGRFALGGVLPGRYAVNVTTPSLDSVNTVDQRSILFADSSMSLTIRVPSAQMIVGTVCRRSATTLGAGIVLGTVVGSDSVPVGNATVTAQWTETTIGSRGATPRTRAAETRTDARGMFRICGLPTATSLDVYAKTDSGEASPLRIVLENGRLFARADLVVHRAKAAASSFTGIVVDTSGKPIPDAEVQLTDVGLAARTAANGTFRIVEILPGPHPVTVRKIGFGVVEAKLDFEAGRPTDMRVVLSPITVLDSVVSIGRSPDPLMQLFEERKRIGLGHFITKDEIVKREGMLLSSFIQQVPGLNLLTAQGYEWVEGKRPTPSGCNRGLPIPRRGVGRDSPMGRCLMREGVYYVPESSEPMPIGCYSRVFLDRQLMNPGQPTPPVNLRELPAPTSIEAVEWYASAAQVPAEFTARNSSCGVLVIHIRRPK